MKLWIDDVRPAPNDEYVQEKTVNNAYSLIIMAFNREDDLIIDLDHDAGDHSQWGGDYIEILKILEQLYFLHKEWKKYIDEKVSFHIHSMNPVGIQNMRRIIQKNGWKEV